MISSSGSTIDGRQILEPLHQAFNLDRGRGALVAGELKLDPPLDLIVTKGTSWPDGWPCATWNEANAAHGRHSQTPVHFKADLEPKDGRRPEPLKNFSH